jgi:hypothetical protein
MNSSSRETILSSARAVRAWAEDLACRNHKTEIHSLRCYCAIASGLLSRVLWEKQIEHEICMATYSGSHVFIEVEDHILDVTATQFSEFSKTPILFMHMKEGEPYWFYYGRETEIHRFPSVKELIEYQRRTCWPPEQRAFQKGDHRIRLQPYLEAEFQGRREKQKIEPKRFLDNFNPAYIY